MHRVLVASFSALFMLASMTNTASPVNYTPPPNVMDQIYQESVKPLSVRTIPPELLELLKSCINNPCLSNADTVFIVSEVAQVYATTLSLALQQQYRDVGNGDPALRADLLDLIRDLQNGQVALHRIRTRAREVIESRH